MSENKNLFILNVLAIIGLLTFLLITEPLGYKLTHLQGLLVVLVASIFLVGISYLINGIFPNIALASKRGLSKHIWNIYFLYIGWISHEMWQESGKNPITIYSLFILLLSFITYSAIKEFLSIKNNNG